MKRDSKIYVAGHTGMVGSSITRKLLKDGFTNLVFTPFPQYDLTNQKTVTDFFSREQPEYVFLAAAKVGGILSNNTYRAQFIYENLMIQNNIFHQSYLHGVKKLLFLGSSCIYPKNCPQPIKEEYLLTGELEHTNEPYAIAKIAGIKMCESYNIQYSTNFISVMPTNLYGPNDNYDLDTSHVLPALMRKMHLGKCLENNDWDGIRKDLKRYPIKGVIEKSGDEDILQKLSEYGIRLISNHASNFKHQTSNLVSITLWGTGSPSRELLYVDDLAVACIFIMNNIGIDMLSQEKRESGSEFKNMHINIGMGKDQTISELAEVIKNIVGFKGLLEWDNSKPDGTPRKLLDVKKIKSLGWKEKVDLRNGIQKVYENYVNN